MSLQGLVALCILRSVANWRYRSVTRLRTIGCGTNPILCQYLSQKRHQKYQEIQATFAEPNQGRLSSAQTSLMNHTKQCHIFDQNMLECAYLPFFDTLFVYLKNSVFLLIWQWPTMADNGEAPVGVPPSGKIMMPTVPALSRLVIHLAIILKKKPPSPADEIVVS